MEKNKMFDGAIFDYRNNPKRYYHNWSHIQEMLEWFAKIKHLIEHPKEFHLAIVFHDVVYDVSRNDNELASCECVKDYLNGIANISIDIITDLIMLTASHGKNTSKQLTTEQQLFVDIDMAIFASDRKRLLEYDEGIFKEYSLIYDACEYKKGRKAFLESIREVFCSQFFKENYEQKALENIKFLLTNY